MKINEHITIEDWNTIGRKRQGALRNGLRFMGFQVSDEWFPTATIRTKYSHWGVFLYKNGDLVYGPLQARTNRISLEEVLSFIELTSFGVRE